MSNLKELQPQLVWNNFQQICDIPHPSKKEARIIEFAKNFGENLNLETIVDEVGNVIIKKPATTGMENRKTIVMQAHLDMVPQKNNDTAHDFEKDPINVYIDNEWVTAKGTTLGADNGIGVAAAMAVLESDDIQHGNIEALFTIDEETGMTGAFALKPNLLDADILVNLDSEDEGELYIGCAGGMDTNAKFTFEKESFDASKYDAYQINVTGLKGGHSGIDIPLGRGNANKLLNRLLWEGSRQYGLRINDFDGGSLRNAIPRDAKTIVVVPKDEKEKFVNHFNNFKNTVSKELKGVDDEFTAICKTTNMPENVMDKKTQTQFTNAIYACPNGVIRMSPDMANVVETSTNLAIVKFEDNNINIASLQRSSIDSAKYDLGNMMRSNFEMAGAEVVHEGEYSGWKPDVNSSILKTMKEVYNNKFNKIPEVKVIHAGLECGIISKAYPNMDMISFGPTIRFPHSPDEKVNIETVGKFWDFLKETLENAPVKVCK